MSLPLSLSLPLCVSLYIFIKHLKFQSTWSTIRLTDKTETKSQSRTACDSVPLFVCHCLLFWSHWKCLPHQFYSILSMWMYLCHDQTNQMGLLPSSAHYVPQQPRDSLKVLLFVQSREKKISNTLVSHWCLFGLVVKCIFGFDITQIEFDNIYSEKPSEIDVILWPLKKSHRKKRQQQRLSNGSKTCKRLHTDLDFGFRFRLICSTQYFLFLFRSAKLPVTLPN